MKTIKKFGLYLFAFAFLFLSVFTLGGCGAPKPTVKEGKFNFSITYAVDEEEKTIASAFVCEFVEAGRRLDGYYITWESYIEDSEIEALFPEYDYGCIIVQTNEDGTIYLDLSLYAEYFMSEPAYKDTRVFKPYLFIRYNEVAAEEKGTYGDDTPEVIASYGVRLVRYECDEPIENSYK